MSELSNIMDALRAWLNANEGVVEGVAVLIAVVTLALPQLRALVFGGGRNNNQTIDISALDPALIDKMLLGAAKGSDSGSFFAPRLPAFGRFDSPGKKRGKSEDATQIGSPTVAIFPLTDLSDSPATKGLCHALADEIATGFSGMAGYEVVAGRALAGAEHHISHLPARYVVEGSIREMDGKVRVISRIVDVATGKHLWADRFDCTTDDLSTAEEALCRRITWQVIDHIQASEVARAAKADPGDLDSWALTVLAFSGVGAAQQKEGAIEAEQLARKAVEQAPESGMAHAVLAATLMQKRGFDLSARDQVSEAEIREAGDAALLLAPDDAMVNVIYGFVMTSLHDEDVAIPHLRKAVEINPVNARAHAHLGRALRNAGNLAEARKHMEQALAIAPRDPMAFIWWGWMAVAQLLEGDSAGAISSEQKAIALSRRYFWNWLVLAAAYALEGDEAEAEKALAEAKQLNPDLEQAGALETLVRDSLGQRVDVSLLVRGLAQAGLK